MELHYFLTTNGALGQTSFLQQELSRYRDVAHLNGLPRSIVSSIITEWNAIAKQNKIETHLIHNCLDNSYEGILFPGLGTGVINTPAYENRYDLACLFQNEGLQTAKRQLEKAYKIFHSALKIHDEWEKIYIQSMNFNALNQLSNDVGTMLLADKKTDYHGVFYDRFLGSATINGAVDYIDNLTQGTKRYFIKGRPGTGKSTLLKKIALSAKERGFHVERYHCAFDPNSLDMVVIRELKIAVFDSTAPHEHFPTEATDEIIDIYELAVNPGTDQKFETDLAKISRRYKQTMSEATTRLIAANEACKQAETESIKWIDKDNLMQLKYNLTQRIFP